MSEKAPICLTCGHMVVFHGAGKCQIPFTEKCECPATVAAVFGEEPSA